MKKSIFPLFMVIILLFSSISPVLAMGSTSIGLPDEETPEEETDVTTDEADQTEKEQPVWQLMLDFYRDVYGADQMPEDLLTSLEDKQLGHGLAVKLFSYYFGTNISDCEGETCPVFSLEEVIANGKLAPGQLFKEFGKPAFMGVGHLRKAYQEWLQENQGENPEETQERKNHGNGVGVPGSGADKDKGKDKDKNKDKADG